MQSYIQFDSTDKYNLHTSWLLLEIPTWANDVFSFEHFAVNIKFAVVRQTTGMEARYLTTKC